jgi:hypothetical protein
MNSRERTMSGGIMRGALARLLLIGMAVGAAGDGPWALARTQASGIQGVVTTRARPPKPQRVTFDQNVCGAELPDHSIVVDSTGHLANVVVTLVGVKARTPPREVKVVNETCAFVPRVQVIGSKGILKTSSKDPVLHTTTVQRSDGRQLFNLALPVPNLELSRPLDGLGALRVGCSTHQWMRGWIYVTDDVSTVTGPDGRFALPDVAPGTYQLHVWHEVLKAADQTVTIAAGKTVTANVTLR